MTLERMDMPHMPFEAGQGDKIILSIALDGRRIPEVKHAGGISYVAYDALWNRCDQLFREHAASMVGDFPLSGRLL